ncbi:hypothetical protein [Actinoplanes sp. TFC3]|uniref:hypothetical protein n=1 Tax=Actinoplanes sp. TFC3 TaxID=1710355 RepID=UPI000AFF5084|nr:hypothetical protein [Actinoplanes sp. TFC3]
MPLRRLYFLRFGFALVWAALLFTTAANLGPLSIALLVLYPAFDVAAAVIDLRSSRSPVLYLNIAISGLGAIGLAIASASGIPAVLRVWGAWAIAAGLVQLVVGINRRRRDGHWPMILSGGLSVGAGTSFILAAAKDGATLSNLAGYAILGGIFFLIAALRLGRQ